MNESFLEVIRPASKGLLSMPDEAVLVLVRIADVPRDAEVHWMSPAELTGVPGLVAARRAEWLAGRIAAKAAALSVIGGGADPLQIAIGTELGGKPVVVAPGRPLAISIAHTTGLAVATAWFADSGRGGVDIESCDRTVPEGVRERAFQAGELDLIGGPDAPIRLWCIKEAAVKALGSGLWRGMTGCRIQQFDGRIGRMRVVADESIHPAAIRVTIAQLAGTYVALACAPSAP